MSYSYSLYYTVLGNVIKEPSVDKADVENGWMEASLWHLGYKDFTHLNYLNFCLLQHFLFFTAILIFIHILLVSRKETSGVNGVVAEM